MRPVQLTDRTQFSLKKPGFLGLFKPVANLVPVNNDNRTPQCLHHIRFRWGMV